METSGELDTTSQTGRQTSCYKGTQMNWRHSERWTPPARLADKWIAQLESSGEPDTTSQTGRQMNCCKGRQINWKHAESQTPPVTMADKWIAIRGDKLIGNIRRVGHHQPDWETNELEICREPDTTSQTRRQMSCFKGFFPFATWSKRRNCGQATRKKIQPLKSFSWLSFRSGDASLKSGRKNFSACEEFSFTHSDILLWPRSTWLRVRLAQCALALHVVVQSGCSHTCDGHVSAKGHLILPFAPFLICMLCKMDGTFPATVCFVTPSCAWPAPMPSILQSILIQNGAKRGSRGVKAFPRPS